jgi:hypothetical protein
MMSISVRILVVGAIIGLYLVHPIVGAGALATVFGLVIAQRVQANNK